MATKKNTIDSKVIKKTSKEKVVTKKVNTDKKIVADKKKPVAKKTVADKKPAIKKVNTDKKIVADKKKPVVKKAVAEKIVTVKKVVAEKKPATKKVVTDKKIVADKKKPVAKKKSVLKTVEKVNALVEERIIDLVDKVRELPDNYKETKLTLIMRDPDWCYFYWDISDDDISHHNIHSRELKVKIFQITGVDIALHEEHTEVSVGHIYGDYYVNLETPHAYFIAELGYYSNGVFTVLIRSNVVYAPRDSISNIYDDKWSVNEEIVKLLSEPSTLRVSLSSATIFELVDLTRLSGSSFSLFNKKDN